MRGTLWYLFLMINRLILLTLWYFDAILNINNKYFDNIINKIHHSELQLNKAYIIALKASRCDCTNNNELLHKIGVLQRYAMQFFVFTRELLQAIRWRSKYNVCTQRIWLQGWGWAPVKPFYYYFLFVCFRKNAGNCSWFTCLQKKVCFDVLCTYKATSISKMARLVRRYSDDARAIIENVYNTAWRKRSLEWNSHWIVYETGLQHSLSLADLPLRKLWKRRRRRHMTSSNSQSNNRHLRQKCHWMTLVRVLYGGPSLACTPWRRFCQPLITSDQSSKRALATLAYVIP